MLIGRSARRLLIVSTAVTVCGVLGAGSAAAATAPDSGDVLGLGGLLNSLTAPVTKALQPALAADSGSTSTPTLGSTLESLPVLGPVVAPVVKALPLLTATPPAKSSSTPSTKPPTGGTTTHRAANTPAAQTGSTWTAPRIMTADPAPPLLKNPRQSGSDDPILPGLPGVVAALTSGKAELGAAAIALIILGGVAVAGAAGAAGATGRRQFVGGPW